MFVRFLLRLSAFARSLALRTVLMRLSFEILIPFYEPKNGFLFKCYVLIRAFLRFRFRFRFRFRRCSIILV